MISDGSSSDPLVGLLEEFLARYRRGEMRPASEPGEDLPELAAEIRDIFSQLTEQSSQTKNGSRSSLGSSLGPFGEPQQVGDYRIVRRIGKGGMGVVYEAERLSLGRRVAIKFLPLHISHDPKLVERFRREARAAAQLHHPNIVPVFDVGQEEDLCYYAMQLIEGQSLDQVLHELRRLQFSADVGQPPTEATSIAGAAEIAASLYNGHHATTGSGFTAETQEWNESAVAPTETAVGNHDSHTSDASFELGSSVPDSDTTPRAVADKTSSSSALLPGQSRSGSSHGDMQPYYRSVAELGKQIADALDYAHQEGVVHRDIKPSNLLLDAQGSILITDFGLAKVEDDGLTKTGDIVGTLRYMAPERFRGNSEARSDVYSLGATLYEMLAMRPAFNEPDRLTLIQRITHDSPPKLRSTHPDIPADLETIVLKAMERQPEHRYQRAGELKADLQRFLDDKPIAARQASHGEHVWRWCRRNRAVAALATMLVVLLIATTATSTIAAFHFRRIAAEREEARTLALQHGSEAERNLGTALHAINRFFVQVSDDPRLKAVGLETLRRDLLQSARDFYTQLAEYEGDRPDVLAEQAKAYMGLAKITNELGSGDSAVPMWRASESILSRLADEHSDVAEYRQLLAQNYNDLGNIYPYDQPQAEAAHRKALRLRERLVQDAPDNLDFVFDLAASHNNVGNVYRYTDRIERAETACDASLELRERLIAAQPDNPKYQLGLAKSWNSLGILYDTTERLEEAEAAFQKAIRINRSLLDEYPGHPDYQLELSLPLGNLGRLFQATERFEQAEAGFREAVELRHNLAEVHSDVPGYHEQAACSHCALATMYREKGRLDEAAAMFRKVIASQEPLVKSYPDKKDYLQSLSQHANKLGNICLDLKDYDDAEKAFRRAIELRRELARSHPEEISYSVGLAGVYCNLAGCIAGRGAPAESLAWYEKAESILRDAHAMAPDSREARRFLRNTLDGRAASLYRLRRPNEAIPVYEEVVEHTKQIVDADPENVAEKDLLYKEYHYLGMCRESQQLHESADCAFQTATKILQELIPTDPDRYQQELGERTWAIGEYARRWGRPKHALEWFDRSIEALKPIHERSPENDDARKHLRLAYEGAAECYDLRGAPKKAAEARKHAQEVVERHLLKGNADAHHQ